jgi:hypothetical protein
MPEVRSASPPNPIPFPYRFDYAGTVEPPPL